MFLLIQYKKMFLVLLSSDFTLGFVHVPVLALCLFTAASCHEKRVYFKTRKTSSKFVEHLLLHRR